MAPIAALVIACAMVASPALAQRLPDQAARPAAIQGRIVDDTGRGVPGVEVELRQLALSGRPAAIAATRPTTTVADGVFRFLDIPADAYSLSLSRDGFVPLTRDDLRSGGRSS